MFNIYTVLLIGALAAPATFFPLEEDQNNKIVGGSNAKEGAFPYIVSLRFRNQKGHYCGGSIINEYSILTAAHCTAGRSPTSAYVVVGILKTTEAGDKYNVRQIINHEKFNERPYPTNDIAVLKLASAIQFNSKVQPISLASDPSSTFGVPAVLAGWGATKFPGSPANHLQYLHMRTIQPAECAQHQPGTDEKNVCTSTPKGQGACHGDSGGPLVSDGVQIGVVSWGKPCAVGVPDVYANVAYYRKWIDEAVQK